MNENENAKLRAVIFLEKALNNQLTLDDFDCDSTKELKGFTQEKILEYSNRKL